MKKLIKPIFFATSIHLITYATSHTKYDLHLLGFSLIFYLMCTFVDNEDFYKFAKQYFFDCIYLLFPVYLTYTYAEAEIGLLRVPLMLCTILFTVYWFYKEDSKKQLVKN
jgi:hypothetical protein